MEKKKPKRTARRAKASTQDVVGTAAPVRERIPPKWREHFQRLLEMRNRLIHRRGGLVRDASAEHPAFSLHMADAGTDNFDRDFALSIASSEQNALYEIEQAMNRIRQGTYGICELTGKRIEATRLRAIPWTRYSAHAEKQLEKEGVVHRPRFAPLEAMPKASGNETAGEEEGEAEA